MHARHAAPMTDLPSLPPAIMRVTTMRPARGRGSTAQLHLSVLIRRIGHAEFL